VIATPLIPWRRSCVQYAASPAPMSARDGGPPFGCAAEIIETCAVVSTTSGRILVVRSCSTATPHWRQLVYGLPLSGSFISVAVHAQFACRMVTSFQCSCRAMMFSASHQLPATESPTSATVSRGWAVSPNVHTVSVTTCWGPRHPCAQ
jgi:hypothetical protein